MPEVAAAAVTHRAAKPEQRLRQALSAMPSLAAMAPVVAAAEAAPEAFRRASVLWAPRQGGMPRQRLSRELPEQLELAELGRRVATTRRETQVARVPTARPARRALPLTSKI